MTSTNPHNWTDEERERAQAVLNADARAITNADRTYTVDPDECSEMRGKLAGPDGPESVRVLEREHQPHRSTIRTHVSGRCHHDPLNVGPAMEYNANFETWQRKNRDKRPVSER